MVMLWDIYGIPKSKEGYLISKGKIRYFNLYKYVSR